MSGDSGYGFRVGRRSARRISRPGPRLWIGTDADRDDPAPVPTTDTFRQTPNRRWTLLTRATTAAMLKANTSNATGYRFWRSTAHEWPAACPWGCWEKRHTAASFRYRDDGWSYPSRKRWVKERCGIIAYCPPNTSSSHCPEKHSIGHMAYCTGIRTVGGDRPDHASGSDLRDIRDLDKIDSNESHRHPGWNRCAGFKVLICRQSDRKIGGIRVERRLLGYSSTESCTSVTQFFPSILW